MTSSSSSTGFIPRGETSRRGTPSICQEVRAKPLGLIELGRSSCSLRRGEVDCLSLTRRCNCTRGSIRAALPSFVVSFGQPTRVPINPAQLQNFWRMTSKFSQRDSFRAARLRAEDIPMGPSAFDFHVPAVRVCSQNGSPHQSLASIMTCL